MPNPILQSAFALMLVLVAPAGAMTVTHAQGETEVPDNPRTVLVLDMASLDTLHALGIAVDGVPAGSLPEYLSYYEDNGVPRIGTLFEPDFEAVNAAEPDLIIVGGRSAPKYAELSRLAPTIDMSLDRNNYVASAQENIVTLAEIFGKQDEAAEHLAELDSKIEALREHANEAGTVLVMLTTGGRMSAHGPGSRFGVIYDDYGFAPAVTELDTGNHGQAISNEFIMETNPDWLFVVDRDAAIGREGEAAAQMLDNELVHQTTAWQSEQIVYLDSVSWYLVGGGLTALTMSIDQLAQAVSND